jgi:hypothetical protein
MKQRGGSVVNSNTVFMIVAIIAVFNAIAYIHVQDWSSIAVFLLAGAVTFSVTMNRTLGVVAAVVAASLFRATNNLMKEGMESKDAATPDAATEVPAATPKPPVIPALRKREPIKEGLKASKYDFLGSEGMSSQLNELQSNQKVLTNGIKALEPLMQQASSMLKGLPSGFLDEALKNFRKNKGKM